MGRVKITARSPAADYAAALAVSACPAVVGAGERLQRVLENVVNNAEAAAPAQGLGLGLSIAAQGVARHGGTIETAAADESGTIVSLRLPLASQHDPR